MISMYLTTYRSTPTVNRRELWADLRIFLNSLEAYGLDYVDEVLIAWDGPWAPDDMPQHPKLKYLERPKGMDQPTAAIWCIELAQGDELIQASDDTVLHPDAMRQLIEDRDAIRQQYPQIKIGAIGTRSNYVVGMQNVRTPNEGQLGLGGIEYSSEGTILVADKIHPVLMYFSREAWETVGRFPDGLIWFGDVLFSYDLKQAGYYLFVSRAYVHHIGMRATLATGENKQDMHNKAVGWLRANRPDFLEYWIQQGYLQPHERYAPVGSNS